jgi:hypothetical protein
MENQLAPKTQQWWATAVSTVIFDLLSDLTRHLLRILTQAAGAGLLISGDIGDKRRASLNCEILTERGQISM